MGGEDGHCCWGTSHLSEPSRQKSKPRTDRELAKYKARKIVVIGLMMLEKKNLLNLS